jgi:hypothetical protein
LNEIRASQGRRNYALCGVETELGCSMVKNFEDAAKKGGKKGLKSMRVRKDC